MMHTEKIRFVKASRLTIWKVTALMIAFAILCTGTAFAATPNPYNVDIYDGEQITRVETSKENAYDIVKQAKIDLGDADKLNVEDFTPGKDSVITIYRAAQVTFTDLNGQTTDAFLAGTVADLLAHLSVEVLEGQLVNVPQDTVLYDGLAVKLTNAYNITIKADGQEQAVFFGEGTVQDLLEQNQIQLGPDDEVEPAMDTPLQDNLTVTVYRVTYTERTARETVSFRTKTEKTSSMFKGESKILQEGKDGLRDVVYRDKIVDGVYASSEEISETVLEEAVPRIKQVGTKQKSIHFSNLKNGGTPISELTAPAKLKIESGAPTEYSKIITGKAAAYTAKPTAKTASGRTVKPGYIAVNPKQIPYGTEMWIVSTDGIVYGYAIAADTGGFVNKGKFTVDLFMSTSAECRQWGSRDVIIYVL